MVVDRQNTSPYRGCGASCGALTHEPAVADGLPTSSTGSEELPALVRTVLTRIAVGDDVSSREFVDAFAASVELLPPARDVVLGSLMTAVMAHGPLAEDVEALLRSALNVDGWEPPEQVGGGDRPVLVLAGSGKKGIRTFNVSTPAALVAATAGARVVKVGSAATSSALGSRDLVRALGLREHRTPTDVRAGLATCGFAFVAIEPEIPALDRLYGGRFHAPNPFSFGLAPLASPVRGDVTVFGLAHPRVDVAARVLSVFGMPEVDVVTTRLPGGYYLDELGSAGEVRRCGVRDGRVDPVKIETVENLAGMTSPIDLVTPSGPREAIEQAGEVLAGGGLDGHRVLVSLNAAHLLVLSGLTASLREGMSMADDILRSGAALPNVPTARTADRSA